MRKPSPAAGDKLFLLPPPVTPKGCCRRVGSGAGGADDEKDDDDDDDHRRREITCNGSPATHMDDGPRVRDGISCSTAAASALCRHLQAREKGAEKAIVGLFSNN